MLKITGGRRRIVPLLALTIISLAVFQTAPRQADAAASSSAFGLGSAHGCAATSSGLMCWGWNIAGQIGDGTTDDVPVPVLVPGALDGAIIAGGAAHTCVVVALGHVKCWDTTTLVSSGPAVRCPAPTA